MGGKSDHWPDADPAARCDHPQLLAVADMYNSLDGAQHDGAVSTLLYAHWSDNGSTHDAVFQLGIFLRALRPARTVLRPARI